MGVFDRSVGKRLNELEDAVAKGQASFIELLARHERLLKDMRANDLLARVQKIEKDLYNPD